MALSDAVLEIIVGMEDTADSLTDDITYREVMRILKGFARELKVAVKASENINPPPTQTLFQSAGAQHRQMIEAAKEEFRKGKIKEEREQRMVCAQGGPANDCLVPVDPNMPVGAFTKIDGATYKLSEYGELVWFPVAKVDPQ